MNIFFGSNTGQLTLPNQPPIRQQNHFNNRRINNTKIRLQNKLIARKREEIPKVETLIRTLEGQAPRIDQERQDVIAIIKNSSSASEKEKQERRKKALTKQFNQIMTTLQAQYSRLQSLKQSLEKLESQTVTFGRLNVVG